MFDILKSSTNGFYDEPIIFETKIDFPIPVLAIGIAIILAFIIFQFMSMFKLFKKSNKSGIASIVPIYNIIVYLQIVSLPAWQVLLFFVPIIGVYLYVTLQLKMALAFNRGTKFGLGLIFFPYIFIPILAYSKAEYFGINVEANTIVVTDIRKEKDILPAADENILSNDEASKGIIKNINVSTGSSFVNYSAPKIEVEEEVNELEKPSFASFRVETKKEEIPKVEEKLENKEEDKGFDIKILEPVFKEENEFVKFKSSLEPRVDETKKDTSNLSFVAPIDALPKVEIAQEKTETSVNGPIVSEKKMGIQGMEAIDSNDNGFVTCSKCGTKIKKGAPKCFICGADLNS